MRFKIGVLFTGLALAATAAHAQEPPAAVPPSSVLAAITGDWDGDGAFDRAVLVEGDDGEADLYLYMPAAAIGNDTPPKLALFKKGAAWRSDMWGTLPGLSLNSKGSLLLTSGNDAIGRSRWNQTLTIVYRDGAFIVAGATFNNRDTLDPKAVITCDLNLLTGQGTRNGKKITVTTKSVRLAVWDDETMPKECKS